MQLRILVLFVLAGALGGTAMADSSLNSLLQGPPLFEGQPVDSKRRMMTPKQKQAYEFEAEMRRLADKIVTMEADCRNRWGRGVRVVLPIPLTEGGVRKLRLYRAGLLPPGADAQLERDVRNHLAAEKQKVEAVAAVEEAAWRRANPGLAANQDLEEEVARLKEQAWRTEMKVNSAREAAEADLAAAVRARRHAEQRLDDMKNRAVGISPYGGLE